jgi:hypothetical protein
MRIEIWRRLRSNGIKYLSAFALAPLALYTPTIGARELPVTLAVKFALTDSDYYPLAGVPVRVAFAGQDWQGADAGQRFTTDAKGEARFIATAEIDRPWRSTASFLPAPPHQAYHLFIAAEFERVAPVGGKDTKFHWLLVSHVDCTSDDGGCSVNGDGIDEIYAKEAQGRFTHRLEPSREAQPMAARTDPDSEAVASGAGYKLTTLHFERDTSEPSGRSWNLRVAYRSSTVSPTAQMVAAAEAGDLARVKAMLAAGADVNGKRVYQPAAALFLAARNNHLAVVRALLAAKADVNAKEDNANNGFTALIAASERGHLEVAQALLAAGADVNAGADAIGISSEDRGATALCLAAAHDHLAVVQALLAAKANVNAKGSYDFTPLINARNSLPILRALLAAGADVNAADKQGHTALGWAKQAGSNDVVELLRRHGGHE